MSLGRQTVAMTGLKNSRIKCLNNVQQAHECFSNAINVNYHAEENELLQVLRNITNNRKILQNYWRIRDTSSGGPNELAFRPAGWGEYDLTSFGGKQHCWLGGRKEGKWTCKLQQRVKQGTGFFPFLHSIAFTELIARQMLLFLPFGQAWPPAF